jgi:hypothetical protein
MMGARGWCGHGAGPALQRTVEETSRALKAGWAAAVGGKRFCSVAFHAEGHGGARTAQGIDSGTLAFVAVGARSRRAACPIAVRRATRRPSPNDRSCGVLVQAGAACFGAPLPHGIPARSEYPTSARRLAPHVPRWRAHSMGAPFLALERPPRAVPRTRLRIVAASNRQRALDCDALPTAVAPVWALAILRASFRVPQGERAALRSDVTARDESRRPRRATGPAAHRHCVGRCGSPCVRWADEEVVEAAVAGVIGFLTQGP